MIQNGNKVPARDSFDTYYVLLVVIKEFNVLIDNKLIGINFIGINLSREINTNAPQHIYITGKSEEDNGVTMFFIAEKQQKQF